MTPRHKFSNQSEEGSTISLENVGNLRGGAYTNLSDLIRMRYTARGLNCFKSEAKLTRLSGLIASKSRGGELILQRSEYIHPVTIFVQSTGKLQQEPGNLIQSYFKKTKNVLFILLWINQSQCFLDPSMHLNPY